MKIGHWISVDKALPIKGSHVLGVLSCGTRLVMCFEDASYGDGWRDVEGYTAEPVYWTPLPDVPEDLR